MVLRVLRRGRRDQHERTLAVGEFDRSAGGSHNSGPITWTWASRRRGYSSCGRVATSTSSSLMPPCVRSSGGEAESLADDVELDAP